MNRLYDDLLHHILGISFDLEVEGIPRPNKRNRILTEIIPVYFSLSPYDKIFAPFLVCKKWYFFYRFKILQYMVNHPNEMIVSPGEYAFVMFTYHHKHIFEPRNWNTERKPQGGLGYPVI